MEQLKTILIEMRKILASEEVGMVCDMSMILDCATRIYNANNITAARSKGSNGGDVKMASVKQKMWLGKMGYQGDVETATLREATAFLDNVWGSK